jgi:hypothetical protein
MHCTDAIGATTRARARIHLPRIPLPGARAVPGSDAGWVGELSTDLHVNQNLSNLRTAICAHRRVGATSRVPRGSILLPAEEERKEAQSIAHQLQPGSDSRKSAGAR